MLGITDPYWAYCFDEAIYMWGTHVENELRQAGEKNQKKSSETRQAESRVEMAFSRLMRSQGEEVPKALFRDPAKEFG